MPCIIGGEGKESRIFSPNLLDRLSCNLLLSSPGSVGPGSSLYHCISTLRHSMFWVWLISYGSNYQTPPARATREKCEPLPKTVSPTYSKENQIECSETSYFLKTVWASIKSRSCTLLSECTGSSPSSPLQASCLPVYTLEGSRSCSPCGKSKLSLIFSLELGPALGTAGSWGGNQRIADLCLSFSLRFSNTENSCRKS